MTEHAAVLAALVLFGLAYNWLIGRIEHAVPDHGYTAIWVIGGVAVTLLATVPLIGWRDALIVLAAFAASGLVMTLGSVQRHLARRQRDLDHQRSELSGN